MSKERTGYVYSRDDKWVARVSYTDTTGIRRSIRRSFQSKSEANKGLKQLVKDLDEKGTRFVNNENQTFADLADYYEEHYLVPPVYIDNRKVAGLRNYKDLKRRLKVLRAHFGKRRLRQLTYGEIEQFKRKFLATPTQKGTARSLADTHRVLTLLRSMLKVAEREDWITRSPFGRGKPLVSMSDEKPRERVLSREEEQRLLACCVGRKAALKPLLICALDTGMRRGELISLKWENVDLQNRLIQIEAFNTKTMRERAVPMSNRLTNELQQLYEASNGSVDELVFNSRGWIHNQLKRACKLAGIDDFRLHDCRHTCATRLVQGGLPLTEVARILGHTTIAMTYRYANADSTTLFRAVAILDGYFAQAEPYVEMRSTMIN
ncbi:MAG: tyrosine-type recombinase/integrase [Acidobacteria bacterium]|nr:tyrosine-type recombinase/integrase [Acidobacteriota bacterium]